MNRNFKTIFCSCGSEAIRMEKDEYNENDYHLYFSMYYNYHYKPNLWRRIKYAFWHIRTGKIYNDQIVLNSEDAKEMVYWLNSVIKK